MTWTRTQAGQLTENSGSSTTHTATLGFTPVAGRLLICWITVDKSSGTITADTADGWTLVFGQSNSSVSIGCQWKVADGDSTDTTPTFTLGTSRPAHLSVQEYSASEGTITLDGSANAYTGSTTTSQTSGTASSLSSTETQMAAVCHGMDTGQGNTFSSYSPNTASVTGNLFNFAMTVNPAHATADNVSFSGTSAAATLNVTGTADQMVGGIVVFYHTAGAATRNRLMVTS